MSNYKKIPNIDDDTRAGEILSEIEEEDKSLELPNTDEILSKTVTTEQRIEGGGGGVNLYQKLMGVSQKNLKQ